MNKKYNRMLCMYVVGKASRIRSVGIKIPYINKEDKKELMEIPYKEAKRVWETLKRNVGDGLRSHSCPWCILVTSNFEDRYRLPVECNNCNYGKRHGLCHRSEDGSDTWFKIVNHDLFHESIHLPSDFYKNLISYIEDLVENDV